MRSGFAPDDEPASNPITGGREAGRVSKRLRVQCPEGDFAVESYDEDELIKVVQAHALEKHEHDIARRELEEFVEDEESTGIE